MKAQLVALSKGRSVRRIELEHLLSIGRDLSNDVVLRDDLTSRNHALIRLQGDTAYYLADLGSSNGTYLNGNPVAVPQLLKSGDEIRIGAQILRFDCSMEGEEDFGTSPAAARSTLREFVRVRVSILVSDIRNFTPMTEAVPDEILSPIVADWFKLVGSIIELQQGTIDKFRGDGVMAYWLEDSEIERNQQVINCLLAAKDIVERACTYNNEVVHALRGKEFKVGCAVHTGEAVLGNFGSDSKQDFTAHGDCVNVAFRMESLCSALGRSVLVSKEVRQIAADEFSFDDLGPKPVKGKDKEIDIFALR